MHPDDMDFEPPISDLQQAYEISKRFHEPIGPEIYAEIKKGKFVVCVCMTMYCKYTDAMLPNPGYCMQGSYDTMEEAEAKRESLWKEIDESDFGYEDYRGIEILSYPPEKL